MLIAKNVNFNETAPKPHNGIITQNGQLLIGQAATPNIVAGFLTPGNGITITNGAGSITVAVNGNLALAWADAGVNFVALSNHGYFITASITATLPSAPNIGDTVAFFVDGAFTVTITAQNGEKIKFATTTSAANGTCANTASGDAMTLVWRATNNQWEAISAVGAWNVV